MGDCSCGYPDWRAIRLSLGITQTRMGQLLYVTRGAIIRYEHQPHRCPPRKQQVLLGLLLGQKRVKRLLAAAGYTNTLNPAPVARRTTPELAEDRLRVAEPDEDGAIPTAQMAAVGETTDAVVTTEQVGVSLDPEQFSLLLQHVINRRR